MTPIANTEQIVIIGGGGHCKAVIDLVESVGKYQIAGIIDLPEKVGKKVFDYEIIATDDDLPQLVKQFSQFHIAIGSVDKLGSRQRLFELVTKHGGVLPALISPRAYVSVHSIVRQGSIVMHEAIINSDVTIGANNIINTAVVIEHDTQIGNHNHIAPSATVNGDCRIDDNCFIGSGSTVSNGVTIKTNTIIGAGAVVLEDTRKNALFAGVPARFKKSL